MNEDKTERLYKAELDASEILETRVCPTCSLTLSSRISTCPNDGTILADTSRLGERLSVQYDIIQEFGSGGIGIVYKAQHLALKRLVAIKMLHAGRMNESSLRRFEQEAKVISSLDHPGIVKMIDYGITESGQPHMVLDFIAGQTLEEALEWHGALPVSETLQIFIQICEALEHAHKKGVLHRDIKPSNIMLSRQESGVVQVKLVDFGIAKIIGAESEAAKLTQAGEVFGSPKYMSPEQASGKPLDQRSDLYSVGIVMFEALTGRPPFSGTSAIDVLGSQINDEAPLLRTINEELPENMESIVSKALSKNPDHRFQSMTQMKNALLDVQTGKGFVSDGVPEEQLNRLATKRLERKVIFFSSAVFVLSLALLLGFLLPKALNDGAVPVRRTNPPLPVQSSSEPTSKAASADDPTAQYIEAHLNDKSISLNVDTTDKSLAAFARCTKTEEVILKSAKITGQGLAYLIHLPLRKLDLYDSDVTDRAVAEIRNMRSLEELDLSHTPVDDGGVKYLADLPNLRRLSLKDDDVGDEGIKSLAKLRKLEFLNLKYNSSITASGMAALAENPTLLELQIAQSPMKDNVLQGLRFSRHLAKLDLSSCHNITDRGVAYLVHSKIVELRVADTMIGDNALPGLAKMKSLKKLDVGLLVSQDAMRAFVRKRPDVHLFQDLNKHSIFGIQPSKR